MDENSLEEIRDNNELIAIIIYAGYDSDGVSFFTPGNFSQQLQVNRSCPMFIIWFPGK